MTDIVYDIKFIRTEDAAKVSDKSIEIIKNVMKDSEVFSLTITSTARTIHEQARVMYENIESTSVNDQKALYASAGDQVIDVYVDGVAAGKDKNAVISLMEAKIRELGAGSVSRHCADTEKLNVVDIAPSSIDATKKDKFEEILKKESKISKYILPPTDPAYHLEIPQ